jgi:predicted tellurium resistance membrane protein TerC/CBS domain-containing protein
LGLATLILLEIVLGIDNLVFLAILLDRLPPKHRDRARQLGLGLALLMRLLMLAGVFWMTTLTQPLFSALAHTFSSRDLIMLAGGAFLLLKATVEIHERLEVEPLEQRRPAAPTGFGAAVAQIVVLDAVFSVDSILTAVGMTNQLGVMMAAVTIAVAMMLFASKPLSEFVNAHPPLVILCLGFLLMIGLSLVADSLGFHIPKGYLYAAIGFSALIESFNQVTLHNRRRLIAKTSRRQRIAGAVLRLLSGLPADRSIIVNGSLETFEADTGSEEAFAPAEKQMIRGVLGLADRVVASIMTPRPAIVSVNLDDPHEVILAAIRNSRHAQLLVSQGSLDRVVGIVRKQDLLDLCLDNKPPDVQTVTESPLMVRDAASILDTIELFKRAPVHAAVVVDDRGGLRGIVTQTDLLQAIAGEGPDEGGGN